MQMNYLLIANGPMRLPQINHTLLYATTPREVEGEITKIIQTLSKVGYHSFTMFDVHEGSKLLATYTVETPDPIVTVESQV